MFPNMQKYYDMKSDKYPVIEVTEEEFRQKCIIAGMTQEKTEFNINICKSLGSNVLVGEEMLKIKSIPLVQ